MEKVKMTKKHLVIALLLLVGITCGYVASTYAKYTETITGNEGEAYVAKWSFSDDNPSQTLVIDFDDTYDATTLVADRVAPGTSGSFDILLTNASTEVGVDFTITLDSITNLPTNMKFYSDSSYTTELTPGTSTITGQLAALDSTGLTVPIYWKWAYETNAIATNDPLDTADGIAGSDLTIGATITGTQVPPSATAITSHID